MTELLLIHPLVRQADQAPWVLLLVREIRHIDAAVKRTLFRLRLGQGLPQLTDTLVPVLQVTNGQQHQEFTAPSLKACPLSLT